MLRKMKRTPSLFPVALLLMACTGNGKGSTSADADSLAASSSLTEETLKTTTLDTLDGFVGGGTSMNVIELVNSEATDTVYLDLDDQTDRQATLEIGNEIRAVICKNGDEIQVVATYDANVLTINPE